MKEREQERKNEGGSNQWERKTGREITSKGYAVWPLREIPKLKPLILSLIKRYYDRPEEYDDLIQEGYMVILRAREDYDPEKAPFLGHVKSKLRFYYLQKNRTRRHVSLDENREGKSWVESIPSREISALEGLVLQEDIQRLRRVLKKLAPREAEIIRRAYLEKMSEKDIAESLHLSRHTVKSYKKSAMKKLRRDLVQKGR